MSNLKEVFNSCMIGEQSVFSFLCGETIDDIYKYFEHRDIQSGTILWEEGDPSDYIAIICSGKIEIKKQTEFKGKHVVVGTYTQGAVVGPLGILDGSPRAVTARAIEDVSLVVLTKENFDALLIGNPELGTKLLKGLLYSVSVRLRNSFDRLSKFF